MNTDSLTEMLRQHQVQRAEGEAYDENEIRKLLAAGVSREQLPVVFAFAQWHVDASVSKVLRKVGLRKGADGVWAWPGRRRISGPSRTEVRAARAAFDSQETP